MTVDTEAITARLAKITARPWGAFMGSGVNQCTALMHEDPVTGMLHFVADFCPDYALDNNDSRLSRGDHIPDMHFVEQAPGDIAALLAEVARLREALQPFAELLKKHQAGYVDAHPVYGIDYSVITVGDLRRARAALQAVEET